MGMLRICAAEGCETKTLGGLCMEHESVSWHPELPPGARSRTRFPRTGFRSAVVAMTSKIELGERGWATDARENAFS